MSDNHAAGNQDGGHHEIGFDATLPPSLLGAAFEHRQQCIEALEAFAREHRFAVCILTSRNPGKPKKEEGHATEPETDRAATPRQHEDNKITYMGCRRGRSFKKSRAQAKVSGYTTFTKCPYKVKIARNDSYRFVMTQLQSTHNHPAFPEGYEPPSTNVGTSTSAGNRRRPPKRGRCDSGESQLSHQNNAALPSTTASITPSKLSKLPRIDSLSHMAFRSSAPSDISSVAGLPPNSEAPASTLCLSDEEDTIQRCINAPPRPNRRTRARSPFGTDASQCTDQTAVDALVALGMDSRSVDGRNPNPLSEAHERVAATPSPLSAPASSFEAGCLEQNLRFRLPATPDPHERAPSRPSYLPPESSASKDVPDTAETTHLPSDDPIFKVPMALSNSSTGRSLRGMSANLHNSRSALHLTAEDAAVSAWRTSRGVSSEVAPEEAHSAPCGLPGSETITRFMRDAFSEEAIHWTVMHAHEDDLTRGLVRAKSLIAAIELRKGLIADLTDPSADLADPDPP